MWLVMKVLWKTLARVLRRFGWGTLLVPAAAMGMALFGVHLWTAAIVALALGTAIWRPAAAASLAPLALVAAGITGLVAAAGVPGSPLNLLVRPISAVPALGKRGLVRFKPPPGGGLQVLAGKAGSAPVQPGARIQVFAGKAGSAPVPPGGVRQIVGPHGQIVVKGGGWRPPPVQMLGLWHGRLLVPLALVLLTLGLWLAPRTVAGLADRAATGAERLRQHMRENRWGVLLVPVAVAGLTIFGVRPWTLALVIAAVVVVIQWPVVAADLVPVVLVAFALYGFDIAARWQSGPGPGAWLTSPVQYGAVSVDSPQLALVAGVQASVFLALAAWLVPRTIGAHARTVFVADPDTALAGQVQRLTESRGHAIDTATSELRRIERDLHDGAQARLVALGMNLRAAERMLPASPQAALALVGEARETSLRALSDLRSLIRGIYPPVLADRGLGHAIQALALDTPLPTELDISLPGRLTAPVESACYFAVAETLANAVKHSGARRVHIRVQHARGMLRIEVTDDGAGGADPDRGTGLRGVERRLGTFDGILAVSSPPGGPTMIVMEVPCALSSPKTCSC
jgi:signal transduction histidine kinase